MEFLGFDNLEKVRNTSRPTTKKQVRSFLGLIGYYRDHIPAFAEISAPLTDLKKGKAEHIQWSEAQERAYSLLKEYLLQQPALKLPDLSKLFFYGRTHLELVWWLCYFRKTMGNYIQWTTQHTRMIECLGGQWQSRNTPLGWRTSQGCFVLAIIGICWRFEIRSDRERD